MKAEVVYENKELQHRWLFFGRDPNRPSTLFESNQYLIQVGKESILTDPGGIEIYPQVMKSVAEYMNLDEIKVIFCSHQDPDIISAIPLWLSLCPNAKVYFSWIWKGFVAHYGTDYLDNLVVLQDGGKTIQVGNLDFEFVPAHYLHSEGNFSLFDHTSRILFSGDIGGGVTKVGYPLYVENFRDYTEVITPFHQRIMSSNSAKRKWVARVRKLGPKMICPQHGAIMNEAHVGEFLDWFNDIEVGIY